MLSNFTKPCGLASAILGVASISNSAFAQTQLLLNSFESSADMSMVKLTNVQVAQDSANVTHGQQSLKVTFQPGAWSTVAMQPSAAWNTSNNGGFAFDVYNPSTAPLLIGFRADDSADVQRTVNVSIEPGGKATFLMTADEDATQYGIRYMPPPYYSMRLYKAAGNGVFNAGAVKSIRFYTKNLAVNRTVFLDNFRAVKPVSPLSRVTGVLDEFGQNTKLTFNWLNKTTSLLDMDLRKAAEDLDLAANPGPGGRSKFGGWADGPRQTATGWFRTEKVNGKWWMVDPEGYLFWSHGLTTVNTDNDTMITGRESMFKSLPASTGYLSNHYKKDSGYSCGPFTEGTVFNFYTANLERKYGSSWLDVWSERTKQRMKSWGFNSYGYGAVPSRLHVANTMPYTARGFVTGNFNAVNPGWMTWGPMPDPFDPDYKAAVPASLQALVNRYKNEPYFMGYQIDNENAWAGTGEENGRYGLAIGVLGQRVATSPAKAVFLADLKAKYTSVANLNLAWGTSYASWTALDSGVSVPGASTAARRADMAAFVLKFCREYFKTIRDFLKSADPNHLYISSSFGRFTPEAVQAAADYTDVIGFNIYRYRVETGPDDEYAVLGAIDKPIMITEFSFGSQDRGSANGGLAPVQWQTHRRENYMAYVRGLLDHPNFVGAHFFRYVDEPISGTKTGENVCAGFLDIADTPMTEMIKGSRALGYEMYTRRY
ncbi:hypothetical protein EON82_13470 [bacterium]|nr:MAG: hypothetical protein EON82_13470 [bacterium]